MYLVSDEARSLLNKNYRQIVKITCNGLEDVFELTESNIAQGGLSINRYCVSGDKIEIGSAVASELTLKLDNRDDRFADTVFEGAELKVQLGIKKWDAYYWENAQIQWIPLGYFTVDETPRKLSYITLSALDRMVRFDKEVAENDITFPITISSLLSVCCSKCNVPLKTIPTSLLNADYVVMKFPDHDELTYRRIIQWIAEISGTCAFIDWNGELCLSGYSSDTDFSLSPSERYSSDMYEQDITITGVQITDDDDNTYLAGTDDYAFNIENNGLIQSNHLEIATAIYNKVKDISYRPYTCTCKPLPYVYPLDGVSYTDKNGVSHKSIVTGITFKMNASTTLEGKGETQTKNGYASANPLTKAESIVLKKLENRVNRKISNYEQASLDMNEIISNSLGLYRSSINEENGSISYYYHNEPSIKDSTIIYTFKAGGFAWTDKWDDEATVWNYGIAKDGNAVLNMLSVYKLTADYIDATDLHVSAANIDGKLTADQIEAIKIVADAADITGQLTSNQIEAGAITTDKIAVGAIGGFTITSSHIQYGGKTSYNDDKSGVFISPNGIGLGAGKLYMTAAGKFHAEEAEITGNITATSGRIGGWYIGVGDGYLRSATGVYGTYSWTTTGADLRYASGYRFVALTEYGFMYVLKNGEDYDNSVTIVVSSTLSDYNNGGSSDAGGGGIIYL